MSDMSKLSDLIKQACEKNKKSDFLCFLSNEYKINKNLEQPYEILSYSWFSDHIAHASSYLSENLTKNKYSGIAISMQNHPETLVWILTGLYMQITTTLLDPRDSKITRDKKLKMINPNQFLIDHEISENIFKKFKGDFLSTSVAIPNQDKERILIQVFTSGSTGFSKVVPLKEKNILSNIEALIEHHSLGPGSAIATALPVYHVNCLFFSFLSSFLSGSKFFLLDKFDLKALQFLFENNLIDIFSTIPEQLRLIELSKKKLPIPPRFKYFLTAAAPLSPLLAAKLNVSFPEKIRQGYGLSEAVNFSATLPANLSTEEQTHWLTNYNVPSIGIALACNEICICNEDGQELDKMQIGGLFIRGQNVMNGYLGENELKTLKSGFLDTGDIGFFDYSDNGEKFFFINGRKKDTAKRYGETLPLAEIDAYLAESILNAYSIIAVNFLHESSGEEIAAIIQLESNATAPDLDKLRDLILHRLPDLYLPSLLCWTTSQIRTSSGKPRRWNFRRPINELKKNILSGTLSIVAEEILPNED